VQLIDLQELKILLEIDPNNDSEDVKLTFFIEYATSIIEEILNRPGLGKQSRTEFHSGTGTNRLLLKHRPVFTTPAIEVYTDDGGYYATASGSFNVSTSLLTYGSDYTLQIDQPDGTSRCGILVRIGDFWKKRNYRQTGLLSPFLGDGFGNIKVVYTGGYTMDTLPPAIRQAMVLMIARMRYILPLGLELTSESYEERSISMGGSWAGANRNYFLTLVKPMLLSFRNWRF
jgi:hypothetical protein